MANTQKPEKAGSNGPITLDVHSIFPTIQGEGPYTGRAAVFIRLAGCNLQCPGCDTEYTQGRELLTVADIVNKVDCQATPGCNLVVITGGEPFRQDISLLCKRLIGMRYTVQVETNGTLPPSPYLPVEVDIVCSPKTGSINRTLIPRIDALKYVMKAGDVNLLDGLPIHALDHSVKGYVARPPLGYTGPIYLQPMDEQDEFANAANLNAVINSCLNHNYTLQLQVHKYIEMD